MYSTLVFCKATNDGQISASNGYHLFSALSNTVTSTFGIDLFHRCKDSKKKILLSALLPSKYWTDYPHFRVPSKITVRRGDPFAFRICFLNDLTYEVFLTSVVSSSFHIGHSYFSVVSFSEPGSSAICQKCSLEEIENMNPAAGVIFHFLSPTGFKSEGRQLLFPTPELVFNSICRQWNDFTENTISPVFDDTVQVSEYDLKTLVVYGKRGSFTRGFLGFICYDWHSAPLETAMQLSMLARFTLFSGVGCKTTQGMGQVYPELRLEES